MSIFKSYDIRGVYPNEINESIMQKIGQAFVKITGAKMVVVGQDAREHSPQLYHALVKGVTQMGASVKNIGLCTTPMFYFAVKKLEAHAGIMVTASHNPGQYNGCKMTVEEAKPFGGSDIQELNKLTQTQIETSENTGSIESVDIMDDYIKKVVGFAQLKRKIKVAVDIGNGMCGISVPKIFEKLDIEPTYLYSEVDMTFPNHEANPIKTQTLQALQQLVITSKADIGIAFDGDGDRCGFVDEKGEIVPMDLAGGLIAIDVLRRRPGCKILYDVRSSKAVARTIEKFGGTHEKVMVGHSNIKRKMRESGAPFALEMSGHYYFEALSFTDSGIMAAIHVLNEVSKNESFSSIMRELKVYAKIDETNFEVEEKDKKIEELKQKFSDGKQDFTDGITVEYDDWWFNVRKSNTEPVLRLNMEANTKEVLNEKLQELKKVIEC